MAPRAGLEPATLLMTIVTEDSVRLEIGNLGFSVEKHPCFAVTAIALRHPFESDRFKLRTIPILSSGFVSSSEEEPVELYGRFSMIRASQRIYYIMSSSS